VSASGSKCSACAVGGANPLHQKLSRMPDPLIICASIYFFLALATGIQTAPLAFVVNRDALRLTFLNEKSLMMRYLFVLVVFTCSGNLKVVLVASSYLFVL
jgi:hypothetical protein